MSVTLKTAEEFEKMRVAGRLAAEVLEMIEPYVTAGITTNQLDQICMITLLMYKMPFQLH